MSIVLICLVFLHYRDLLFKQMPKSKLIFSQLKSWTLPVGNRTPNFNELYWHLSQSLLMPRMN